MRAALATVGLLAACTEPADPEPLDWFDEGVDIQVRETVLFTDQNYDFTGATAIADLPVPGDFETWFAPDADATLDECAGWLTSEELPVEITGIVTIHPRFYIKVSGCLPPDDFTVDSDEKYYGSFYIQDESGGFFVLGNTRVSRFDMGDRVTLRVNAVKEYFDSVMVSAHDVVAIERGPEPIYYREVSGRLLGTEDQAQVVRVEGTVAAEASNFGEIYLCTGDNPDTTLLADQGRNGDLVPACARSNVTDPPWYKIGLDVELQRRGVTFEPGTRVQATGPVHLSFGDHQVAILRIGQLQEL